jgi:hypothetical protein
MSDLRSKIIRLAHQNPELRPHLLPLVTRTAASSVLQRVAELLPYDYTSLLVGVSTGLKTPSGMDQYDNIRVQIPEKVDASDLENLMMSAQKKHPKSKTVKLYGLAPGLKTDALALWTAGRGFGVPDYVWEASNLSKTTRREVAGWVNGRGKNPAISLDSNL